MRSAILSVLTLGLAAMASASPVNEAATAQALVARTTPAEDRNLALQVHNQVRSQVGLPPLTWDSNLQNAAQAYADQLVREGKFEHGSAGENLYGSSAATDHDLQLASQAWANEKPNYHGEVIPQGDFESYGHYTQMVWRNTQRVGLGATRDSRGGVIVVARYDPVGNFAGQKPF